MERVFPHKVFISEWSFSVEIDSLVTGIPDVDGDVVAVFIKFKNKIQGRNQCLIIIEAPE